MLASTIATPRLNTEHVGEDLGDKLLALVQRVVGVHEYALCLCLKVLLPLFGIAAPPFCLVFARQRHVSPGIATRTAVEVQLWDMRSSLMHTRGAESFSTVVHS